MSILRSGFLPSAFTLATLALPGCGAGHAPIPANAAGAARTATWSYDVAIENEGKALDVAASFGPGSLEGVELSVTEGAEPFVKDVRSDRGTVAVRGANWTVTGCADGCTLHYRFALAEAIRPRSDEVASGSEGEPQAPPPTWLLRPLMVRDTDTFAFKVRGGAFAVGAHARNMASGEYRGLARELGRSPYALFGKLRVVPVNTAGTTLKLVLGPTKRTATDEQFVAWVERAATAVTATFGRFPMDGAMIGVMPGRGSRVGYGRAMAGPLGGSILVDIGAGADENTLKADWVLVHEMIHLGIPSLDRRHRWAEEGIATYMEPMVRARAGMLAEEDVWTDFSGMMHNGLPEPGDRGIDRTPTWGRVYWGGALFWFVVDVEIRKKSNGSKTLDDALRSILEKAGDNGVVLPIETVLAAGDAAIAQDTLVKTYRAWKEAPVNVDLDALFRDLGVIRELRGVRFDDGAPLAAIRKAMTAAGPK